MEGKVYLILVLNGLSACMGRGPHHPPGQSSVDHKHRKPSSSGSLLSDTELLHDTKHLEEDAIVLTAEALAKMTPEELEFHYFSSHDYDKNSKLDGLEMLKVDIMGICESWLRLGRTGRAPPVPGYRLRHKPPSVQVGSGEGGDGFYLRTGIPVGIFIQQDGPVIEHLWLNMCAVYHTLEHAFPEDDEEDPIENEADNIQVFIAIVDRTLRLDDTDDDGYVSYLEYRTARINNTEDRSPRVLM